LPRVEDQGKTIMPIDNEPSDREGFLLRWSRRKRGEAAVPVGGDAPQPQAEPFDIESLPPLESLGATSDYRAFLQNGVPAELRRLALRSAWASDPAIAGFRGYGEYDWDFNAPGYGWLDAADDVAALAERVLGPAPPREPDEVTASSTDGVGSAPDLDEA
jgi:hypothetical protein